MPVGVTTVDGCGAPLFGTTPAGLARAFATLATAAPDTPEGGSRPRSARTRGGSAARTGR
nr:asparaginase [Pseudonocardia sp. AL041005-10]